MTEQCAASSPLPAVLALRRIQPFVAETPLRPGSAWLNQSGPGRALLKLENLQTTGSFKLRGAANKLLSLTAAETAAGVVTASNGNFAFGVATMGQRLKIATEVFVSRSIDPSRIRQIEGLGARVRQVEGVLAAEQTARSEAERTGRVYASPYNDPAVIAGQGTIAVEILRHGLKLDALFVAVGCGGLIGGIGEYVKAVSPGTEVVGCWPENSPVLYECLRAGRIIDVAEKDSYSVSTLGNLEPGSVTFPLCQKVIDRKVLVTEEAILAACRGLYREERQRVEGAAGVAVAAYLQVASQYEGKTVALVICGGNADPALAHLIIQA